MTGVVGICGPAEIKSKRAIIYNISQQGYLRINSMSTQVLRV